MRLLYVCWLDPATTDLPLFSARAWEKRGHIVRLAPYDRFFSLKSHDSLLGLLTHESVILREKFIYGELVKLCREMRADAVLLSAPFLSPKKLNDLKRSCGVHLGFSLGYNNLLGPDVADTIASVDFVLVHDPYLIPIIQGTSNRRCPRVFPFAAAADPIEHRPLTLSDDDQSRFGCDIAFIGGASPCRISMLRGLTEHKLRIWGYPSWKSDPILGPISSSEPVYGIKKTKVYNAARITLCIEDSEKNIHSLSARVPEVLACGGFVLCQETPDLLKSGLVPGHSVATFSDKADLWTKVRHFLMDESARSIISQRGRAHVLAHMTYDQVYGPILSQVEAMLPEILNDARKRV